MNQAVEAYRGITATDEFRNLEWLRRKTMNDEAQAIYSAELRGRNVGQMQSVKSGKPWLPTKTQY